MPIASPAGVRRGRVAAVCVALAVVSPARAQFNAMQVYGPGSISCATYLEDKSLRINADGWILGFWTGSNRTSDYHNVGHSTDAAGIVAEVALACRDQPLISLYETVKRIYDQMRQEAR